MSENENQGKEPLLYINQPKIKKTELHMQSIYRTDKQYVEKDTPEIQKNEKVSKTLEIPKLGEIPRTLEVSKPGEVPKTLENPPDKKVTIIKDEGYSGMRRLKSFREMDIMEKLNYLAGFSTEQPLYYCDFLMNSEEVYRGILHQLFEDDFIIKTMSSEYITKKINELKLIRIVQK